MLKMDHPYFLYHGSLGLAGGGSRPGDGHVCLFQFDGSGAGLPDEMPVGRSTGKLQNNRPVPASKRGRYEIQDDNNGIRQQRAAQNPALKSIEARAKIMAELLVNTG